MKLTRLFTTTFDPFLKAEGFKRKGKVYSRLKGEILQGVVIKAINPYSIHYFAKPYWLELHGESWSSLAKGYWAEGGFIGVKTSVYYREEFESLNEMIMNFCLNLAKEKMLPILDKITDVESYLKSIDMGCDYYSDWFDGSKMKPIEYSRGMFGIDYYPNETVIYTLPNIWLHRDDQYAFLYKAYLDNDFEKAEKLLGELLSLVSDPKHVELTSNVFYEKKRDNDLLWIVDYIKDRKAKLLPRLRDELGLNTFDL